MTVRQRWTFLYPLLVLAVCLGIKGELADKRLAGQMNIRRGLLSVPMIKTNEITVPVVKTAAISVPVVKSNAIFVTTPDGKPCIEMRHTPDGAGLVSIFGPKSKSEPLLRIGVNKVGDHGVVEIRDADGRLVTLLAGTEDGGVIQVVGKPNQRSLLLGHQGTLRVSGLMALEPNGNITQVRQGDKRLPWGSYVPWYEEPPDADSDDAPTELPEG